MKIREIRIMEERFRKWRLILGKKADPAGEVSLEGSLQGMDNVLERTQFPISVFFLFHIKITPSFNPTLTEFFSKDCSIVTSPYR